jgi:hypothetical protein
VRRTLLSLLAVAVLLCGWRVWVARAGSAQEEKNLKPVAVVSLAGYDKLLGDVALAGKLSDNPDLARGLEAILKLFTKSQGLAGLDKARPWGAVVQTDGHEVTGCAFLPVTDLSKLGAALKPLLGQAEDIGDGVYKVNAQKKPLYVKEKDGWAFLADKPEQLVRLPADPAGLLAGMNTRYDAAVRILAANIPQEQREKFFAKMKKDAERDDRQRPGEPDRAWVLRKKVGEEIRRMLVTTVNDLDTVTLGWTLDTSAEKTYAEISVTAKEGTETARAMANLRETKSRFSGFRLPGAALTGNWAGQMPAQKAALLAMIVDAVRDQAVSDIEQKGKRVEEGKRFVDNLASLLRETVNDGRVDGGMALLLQPDAVTVLAGGRIADGAKLTDAIKLMAKVASEEQPVFADWIKLDAEEYRSIHFHAISIPIPPDAKDREKVVSLIGEKLEVVIGVGPQSVYVALGREPLKTLKQAIDQSAADADKTVAPLEMSLALGAAAKFLAAVAKEEDRPKFALVARGLEDAVGRDHVKLVAAPIPNGVRYRLEFEDGILKLIGRLATTLDP